MAGIALGDRLRIGAVLAGYQVRSLVAATYTSPFYRWRFSGGAPDRLVVAPQDLRTADPTAAVDIYHGRFALAGFVAETAGDSPFGIEPPSPEWHRSLHGFGWLRHLRAADTELARIQARALIADWIGLYGSWHPRAWDADVTARRLISWFSHSPLILKGADHVFYRRFMRSISRQARYLARAGGEAADGAPRLTAAIALCHAGLCMNNRQRLLRQASRWLDEELGRQILPDGGHVSRNPGVVIELLLDLLPLRQTFAARDLAPSPVLLSAIDRMMPMLRFFRHGDGALAHFNGMGPTYPDTVATLLAYDDARGKPVSNAPYSGYQRLEAGGTLMIDEGAAPPPRVSREAHAGCLSFELSSGIARIVVNCGVPSYGSRQWRTVSRSTAAHSTATLDDTSSCRFASGSLVVKRLGPIVMAGPRSVPVERHDEEVIGLAASHDGYRSAFGIIHERRIAMAPDGGRIDGEDVFSTAPGVRSASNPTYAVRFHLHPQIRASRTRDGSHVVLALPSGEAWEFYAGGADMSIEESVYLGSMEGPRRTEQMVIHGRCKHAPRVSWRFRRLEKAPRRRGDVGTSEELPFDEPPAEERPEGGEEA